MNYAPIVMICFMTLTGCNGSLSVSNGLPGRTVAIEGLDRLSAKPGEVVTVKGTNLTDDIEVLVNGQPATFHRIDDKSGTVEMPLDMEPGLVRISFSRKSKPIGNIPLMNGDSVDALTPTTVPLESICDSYVIKTQAGELARGKAACTRQQTLCEQEGQTDCKTTASFPAVVKADLASNILEGQTLAGVNGTATPTCDD